MFFKYQMKPEMKESNEKKQKQQQLKKLLMPLMPDNWSHSLDFLQDIKAPQEWISMSKNPVGLD